MGKKSSKTTKKTVYGNTTTSNPYVTSTTNNGGTVSKFMQGSAFDSINNFVNSNVNNLLDEYLNPSLNSTTNQAKMNSFMNNLNKQTLQNFENGIINPLSNRNMVRSSQATNMYNKLAENNAKNIADYSNELLANSQNDTAAVLNNLMSLYLSGFNIISENQNQSLNTSKGNATETSKTVQSDSLLDTISKATQLALSVASFAAGGAGGAAGKAASSLATGALKK